MFTAPPVMDYFPGSGGWGPVAYRWWTMFCAMSDAKAMQGKVAALGNTAIGIVDEAGAGGDYAAFGSYFQYMDATTRMWGTKGTITVGGVALTIDEMLGELIDAETVPRQFVDTYQKGQTPVLMFRQIDSTDVEIYWGANANAPVEAAPAPVNAGTPGPVEVVI